MFSPSERFSKITTQPRPDGDNAGGSAPSQAVAVAPKRVKPKPKRQISRPSIASITSVPPQDYISLGDYDEMSDIEE